MGNKVTASGSKLIFICLLHSALYLDIFSINLKSIWICIWILMKKYLYLDTLGKYLYPWTYHMDILTGYTFGKHLA